MIHCLRGVTQDVKPDKTGQKIVVFHGMISMWSHSDDLRYLNPICNGLQTISLPAARTVLNANGPAR
jgi:hypothetical protein